MTPTRLRAAEQGFHQKSSNFHMLYLEQTNVVKPQLCIHASEKGHAQSKFTEISHRTASLNTTNPKTNDTLQSPNDTSDNYR